MNEALLPYQWEAIHSPFKYTLLLGGIGSGKSHTGSPWVIKKLKESPDSLGLITANTYSQLMSATLANVFKNLERYNVPFTFNGQTKTLTVAGIKRFLCLSAESFDNHRGIEVGEWWGDEAAYYKEEAFKVFSGRLRDKRGQLDVLFTTTPKGFNWLYDYFHESGEKRTDEYNYIKAKSELNKHLPSGYIDSLKQQYDSNLIEQELNGEFVNLTSGKTYYAFDRDLHVKETKQKGFALYCGMDFNVDPMTACVAEIYDDTIYVHDERFLRNSNTDELATSLLPYRGLQIIPDSTASNRKTSGRTDLETLTSYGFKVLRTHNPYVMDRVNNVNRLLAQGRIIINPRCKKLINDLEKVSWMDGKIKLDQTTDKLLTHISDSLGYLCHKLLPMHLHTPKITSDRK